MKDIVFALGGGSRWQDNEIRYSLRSIEKHLKNFRNIYIIGQKPGFLTNVHHIAMEDEHRCKETNIYRKVLRACQESDITDQFLFFNDDHFLNADFDADTFPDFYKGYLQKTLEVLKGKRGYRDCIEKTIGILQKHGHDTKHFDTHTPILYDKVKFIQAMANYDWTHSLGFVVKSLYANSLKLEGVKEKDRKVNLRNVPIEEFKEIVKISRIWSIDGSIPGEAYHKVFEELYPVPSRWERF